MTTHQITSLGELEREVLEIVWKRRFATADTVQKELSRPLKESTVRTVLKRLEQKGLVSHTVSDRTFIFCARETRAAAAARAVKDIVDRFCNGSVEDVLVGLIEHQILGRRELKRLADKIARVRGGYSHDFASLGGGGSNARAMRPRLAGAAANPADRSHDDSRSTESAQR